MRLLRWTPRLGIVQRARCIKTLCSATTALKRESMLAMRKDWFEMRWAAVIVATLKILRIKGSARIMVKCKSIGSISKTSRLRVCHLRSRNQWRCWTHLCWICPIYRRSGARQPSSFTSCISCANITPIASGWRAKNWLAAPTGSQWIPINFLMCVING